MDTIAFGVGARKVCWPDGYNASRDNASKAFSRYVVPVLGKPICRNILLNIIKFWLIDYSTALCSPLPATQDNTDKDQAPLSMQPLYRLTPACGRLFSAFDTYRVSR